MSNQDVDTVTPLMINLRLGENGLNINGPSVADNPNTSEYTSMQLFQVTDGMVFDITIENIGGCPKITAAPRSKPHLCKRGLSIYRGFEASLAPRRNLGLDPSNSREGFTWKLSRSTNELIAKLWHEHSAKLPDFRIDIVVQWFPSGEPKEPLQICTCKHRDDTPSNEKEVGSYDTALLFQDASKIPEPAVITIISSFLDPGMKRLAALLESVYFATNIRGVRTDRVAFTPKHPMFTARRERDGSMYNFHGHHSNA